jgi:hypothetical protein
MLHKVFEIDEILRPIAGYVVGISGSSAIALACCCEAFEEPVLSSYWEDQCLDKLASVFPEGVLKRSDLGRSPYYVRASGIPQASDELARANARCVVDDHTPSHPRGAGQIVAICILDQTDCGCCHAAP